MVGILLITAGVPSTVAQAGPPCGPDLPIKCNPGKGAAILLAFIGAGALAVYLGYRMDHPKGQVSIAGCTTLTDGAMTLTEDGTGTLYVLTPVRENVKAGGRVVLRGKKNHDAAGRNVLNVKKVVKNDGPCQAQSSRENNSPGPG